MALLALLIGSSCSGGEGAGGDADSTVARPSPPGPPTDACALLDAAEVDAISPGAAGEHAAPGHEPLPGEGTETETEVQGSLPGGPAPTRYADCSWPAVDGAAVYLTWVQPSPTSSATTWLERTVVQSADAAELRVEPLEAEHDQLDAALLLQGSTVLRVAGVVSGTDLLTIEVLSPPVARGSAEQAALEQALTAAAARLLGAG